MWILHGEKKLQLQKTEGSLLAILRQAGIPLSAPCGGRGVCGKCAVEIDGIGPVLACQYEPQGEEVVRIPELAYDAVTRYRWAPLSPEREREGNIPGESCLIAVDLGTTTLAMELVGLESGCTYGTWSGDNPQKSFGADVISRISAALSGQGEVMTRLVRIAMREGMRQLLAEADVSAAQISHIVIAGNTVMLHLFWGHSCEGLAGFPFTPETLEEEKGDAGDLFGVPECNAKVVTLPGFSAFVGADILSGLLPLFAKETPPPFLYLDLGTNGECALWNGEKLYLASASAGPAFEGGGISCGVGSVPGAICGADVKGGGIQIKTIGNRPAIGICGTGLVEIVASLRELDICDETGLLREPYFSKGYLLTPKGQETDQIGADKETSPQAFFQKGKNSDSDGVPSASASQNQISVSAPQGKEIRLTQQDIRAFQMAKGAIRAAARMICEAGGVSEERLQHLYLAGGFGFSLDFDAAAAVGLLSEKIGKDRVLSLGNASLAGAVFYGRLLETKTGRDLAAMLRKNAVEVALAGNERFTQYYIEEMNLGS